MRTDRIREELEAHIADCAEEYRTAGLSHNEAMTRARRDFGDEDAIANNVRALHYPSATWYPLGAIALVALLIIQKIMFTGQMELLALRWISVSVIVLGVLISTWILEFWGLRTHRGIWIALLFLMMTSSSITATLDIDNFEVTLHALVAVSIVGGVIHIFHAQLSPVTQRRIIMLLVVIILYAALTERALFDVFVQPQCLFVTSPSVPLIGELAQCHRVQWNSFTMMPVIGLLIMGIPVLLHFVDRYIRSRSTNRGRKMIMVATFVLLPVVPALFPGMNDNGEIDILPWKKEIIAAYRASLGRHPEEKDLSFYAMTRAYENMDRVKDVLYASPERMLKIRLVFQETEQREPTEEEMRFFVEQRTSINDMKKILRRQQ